MPSDLDRLHRVHDRAKELSRLPDFRRAVADAYPRFVQAVANYERDAAAAVEHCVAAARAALADGRVRTTYNGEPLAHLYLWGSASPKPLRAPVTEKRLAAAVLDALDAGYDGRVEHGRDPGVWGVRIELRKPIPFESGLLVSCVRPKLPTLIDPRHARSVDALLWMHEHAPDVYRLVALYHVGGLADLHSVNPIVPKPSHTGVPTDQSVMADVYWKARFPTTGPNRATSGLDPAVMPADAAEMLLRVVEQKRPNHEGGSVSRQEQARVVVVVPEGCEVVDDKVIERQRVKAAYLEHHGNVKGACEQLTRDGFQIKKSKFYNLMTELDRIDPGWKMARR